MDFGVNGGWLRLFLTMRRLLEGRSWPRPYLHWVTESTVELLFASRKTLSKLPLLARPADTGVQYPPDEGITIRATANILDSVALFHYVCIVSPSRVSLPFPYRDMAWKLYAGGRAERR